MGDLKVKGPLHCRACLWKPNLELEKTVDNTFISAVIPNTPIYLFVCPKCGFIMTQDNLVEIVEALIKTRENSIITSAPKIISPSDITKARMN